MNQKNTMHYCRLLVLIFLSSYLTATNYCLASNNVEKATSSTYRGITISGDINELATKSEFDSDTDFTTRLIVKVATRLRENLEIAGRINTTKSFGTEPPWPDDDDDFLVDQLYFSWSDITKTAFGFSGGRLPTAGETSPSYLRLGLDQPKGTLSPFLDIVLDGVALSYRYQKPFQGEIELFYATQSDLGYESNIDSSGLSTTDIYGLKLDVMKNENRTISFQSFILSGILNIPNHANFYLWGVPLRHVDLGDIYQSNVNYVDTYENLHFFISLGWSHTNPKATDDLGNSLLSSWWGDQKNEDGYSVYAGMRYDLNDLYTKIGFEFNYGSKYWINFSQDTETTKLGTRGSVAEAYLTFEPPLSPTISKWTNSVIGRIGCQYYDYRYTGSGYYVGEPLNIDTIKSDPLYTSFYDPIDNEYKIYAALEISF